MENGRKQQKQLEQQEFHIIKKRAHTHTIENSVVRLINKALNRQPIKMDDFILLKIHACTCAEEVFIISHLIFRIIYLNNFFTSVCVSAFLIWQFNKIRWNRHFSRWNAKIDSCTQTIPNFFSPRPFQQQYTHFYIYVFGNLLCYLPLCLEETISHMIRT